MLKENAWVLSQPSPSRLATSTLRRAQYFQAFLPTKMNPYGTLPPGQHLPQGYCYYNGAYLLVPPGGFPSTPGMYPLPVPYPSGHPSQPYSSTVQGPPIHEGSAPSALPTTASQSTTSRSRRLSPQEKLEAVLDYLHGLNWTLSEFLYYLFRLKDEHGQPVHRSQSHGITVQKFLSGKTTYKSIQIVDFWLRDPAGAPAKDSPAYGDMFSLRAAHLDVAYARPALTSMAMQLCSQKLLAEMRKAVRGSSGLHGSQVGKRGHMELACDDIGLHTLDKVKEVISKYQPVTFELLRILAAPELRKVDGVAKERKTRPPELVSISPPAVA